jgi:hypothetical protein
MSDRTDILLDEDNDLKIVNGDFVIGPSDMQHVEHILVAHPGEYKEHPQVGIGIERYLKSTGQQQNLKREIRIQLAFDGYQNPDIELSENLKLKIKV